MGGQRTATLAEVTGINANGLAIDFRLLEQFTCKTSIIGCLALLETAFSSESIGESL